MRKTVFHHIPKTGGTTMISILNQQVNVDEIASNKLFGMPAILVNKSQPKFKDLKNFPLIHGHFDATLFDEGFNDHFRFTILRRPIKRLYSLFNDWKNKSESDLAGAHDCELVIAEKAKKMDLYTFLEEMDFPEKTLFDNATVRQLSGKLKKFKIEEEDYDLAVKNLESMDFVCLLELFDLSLHFLFQELDIKSPNLIPKLNYRNYDRDLEINDKIKDACYWDEKLYRIGISLFHEKTKKIIHDSKPKPIISIPKVDQMDFKMSMGLKGVNWHEREGVGTDKVWRWTGPNRKSSFDINLNKNSKNYTIKIKIISVIDQEIVNNLNLYFNDNPIPWKLVGVEDGEQVIVGHIDPKLIHDNDDKIEIEVPYTISHHEVDPTIIDKRKKGVAITEISIAS